MTKKLTSAQKKGMITTLDTLLNKAIMNANLKLAVTESKKALQANNIPLAADLTAVKSQICGAMRIPKKDLVYAHHCTFRENQDTNEKRLRGKTVYRVLDGMHHTLAFAADQLPSGAVVYTRGKAHERAPSTAPNKIIRLMNTESASAQRYYQKKYAKST